MRFFFKDRSSFWQKDPRQKKPNRAFSLNTIQRLFRPLHFHEQLTVFVKRSKSTKINLQYNYKNIYVHIWILSWTGPSWYRIEDWFQLPTGSDQSSNEGCLIWRAEEHHPEDGPAPPIASSWRYVVRGFQTRGRCRLPIRDPWLHVLLLFTHMLSQHPRRQ